MSEKFKKEQTCEEKMIMSTDPGSIALWIRDPGDCVASNKVWSKIVNIVGSI